MFIAEAVDLSRVDGSAQVVLRNAKLNQREMGTAVTPLVVVRSGNGAFALTGNLTRGGSIRGGTGRFPSGEKQTSEIPGFSKELVVAQVAPVLGAMGLEAADVRAIRGLTTDYDHGEPGIRDSVPSGSAEPPLSLFAPYIVDIDGQPALAHSFAWRSAQKAITAISGPQGSSLDPAQQAHLLVLDRAVTAGPAPS